MKTRTLGIALAGVATAALIGVTANGQTSRNAAVVTQVTVPATAENFRLVDNKAFGHELYYFKNSKAVVLISHKVGSKHIAAAADTIEKIAADYADQDVEVFLINSNPADSREAINADLKAIGLEGVRVLQDDTQLIGESLGISREAEALVIQPGKSFAVAYHGPIDNRFAGETPKANAKVKAAYVTDALDAIAGGNAVKASSAELKSPAIAFPNRARKAEFANISYSETVAPLIAENCAACHAENGIAPFALNSYEMVKGFAPMIREVIRTDRMPPYNADRHMGEYKDDMNLTAGEMQTLVHWIEAGAPRGSGPDILKAEVKPAPEWPLGEPDAIVTMPEYEIPATGIVDYQYPKVQNPLTEGRWLRASTVNVGDRQAVHHLLSTVGNYAVGAETTVYPEDTGVWIEPGADVSAQLHYTPYGKATTDISRVGMYFYPKGEEPKYIRRSAVVVNSGIEIPAGEARHKEVAYMTFPADATLYTVYPHAHYRGDSMQIFLQKPGGKEELILSLPKYDFNWQRGYDFAEPIQVKPGTKIITRYVYDNSVHNPANPDPTETVTWGEQSHEEMQFTSFSYRWNDETVENQTPQHQEALQASLMIGALDKNIDDKLQRAEIKGRMGQMLLAQFDKLDADTDGALSLEELKPVASMMNRGRRRAEADGVAPS